MVWFSVLSLTLLITSTVGVLVYFNNKRESAERFVYWLMVFLLAYKSLQYLLFPTAFGNAVNRWAPVEISSVSYFFLPIAYLSGVKWLREPSVFIAFLAGFIQMVAFGVSPGPFLDSPTMTSFSFAESILMHYILFLSALVYFTRVARMQPKNFWKVLLTLCVVLGWGILAAYTWRYDHVLDKPENIMFLHECVLPKEWASFMPWVYEGRNFLVVYLAAFAVFTLGVYGMSYFATKKQRKCEPSIWCGGPIKKYVRALETAAPQNNVGGDGGACAEVITEKDGDARNRDDAPQR